MSIEVKLDTLNPAEPLPNSLYVSVRVGEVQKLSKFCPSRVFRVPKAAAQERRHGKIEVFRRIGGASIAVDSGASALHQDVTIPLTDGSEDVQFKVGVSGYGQEDLAELSKPPKESNPKVLAAKEYLQKHNFEIRLSEAMQELLRERPDDPAAFVAAKLMQNNYQVSQAPAPTPAVAPKETSGAPQPAPAGKAFEGLSIPAQPPINTLRDKARSLLMDASGDGRLKDALEKSIVKAPAPAASTSNTWFAKPSCGTWLAPIPMRQQRAIAKDPQMAAIGATREQACNILQKATSEGKLLTALKGTSSSSAEPDGVELLRLQAQALFKEASRDGRLLHALEHTLATGETAAQPPAVEDVRAQAHKTLMAGLTDGRLKAALDSVFQEEKSSKGRMQVCSSGLFLGAQAYSCGMRPTVRCI
mmetsp:Transcript_14559/g.33082  ORF Transcript_14559/g.33082 Transcript_14559/m.33082 type:complete len:417 (-) Transcript_14559:181-1431(-)